MKDNKEKVTRKLFEKPEYHYHIRELARETKLHPNTIIAITDELARENLLTKKKYKKVIEIYYITDSLLYKRKKRLFNLAQLYESGLVDYLIDFYHHPQAIILFGSFSRGEDWSNSDIDLMVSTGNKAIPSLTSYEQKLKRSIHLIAAEYKELSSELYQNLINGVLLYGYIKDERISKVSGRRKS